MAGSGNGARLFLGFLAFISQISYKEMTPSELSHSLLNRYEIEETLVARERSFWLLLLRYGMEPRD